jgi:single-strand DNA-binding protein
VNAYKANDGEAKATLTFHVNTIKLHGSGGEKNETAVKTNAEAVAVPTDDLPF